MDPLLRDLEVYQVAGGKVKQLFAGGLYSSFFNRPISTEDWLFSLDLSSDSVNTFFIKGSSNFPFQIPILLSAKDAFISYYQMHNIFWGIYMGTMLFALIYNLFIFFSVRERAYLYYIFYIICSSLFYLSLQGFSFQFFWPYAAYLNAYIPLFICSTHLFVVLYLLFSLHFAFYE
jgi:hypothetical protein